MSARAGEVDSRKMREILKAAADDLRVMDVGRAHGRRRPAVQTTRLENADENAPAAMPWMKEGHKSLPTRTSVSHPMTVSWIDAGAATGALGLCYCPGKNVVRSIVCAHASFEKSTSRDMKRERKICKNM